VAVFTCGADDSPNKPSDEINIADKTSDPWTTFAFMRFPHRIEFKNTAL
jgi:hypothetical protein